MSARASALLRAGWGAACLVAAAGIALGFYGGFRLAADPMLPRLAQMRAACGPHGAAARLDAPADATPARCQAYFADRDKVYRPAAWQSAVTGLIAAYVLLVLRFRVRPLPRAAGREPPAQAPE